MESSVGAGRPPNIERCPRILSLDGGGVRGLSSLLILRNMMEEIARRNGTAEALPCQYFDLIGGTGTGGLIAIMLGWLGMSVDESIDEYINLSRKVFEVDQVRKGVVPTGDDQCRFDYRKLENAVKNLVERKLQNANAVMADTHSQKIPTFVVATKGLHADGPPTLFRSYQCAGYNADKCAIWEAARATSALPLFFKPIKIKTPAPGSTYVDGGLAHNNPGEVALSEGQRLWGSVKRFSLVSVGTGRSKSIRIVETNTNQSLPPKTSTLGNLIRGPPSGAAAGEIALTRIREACVELAFNSEHVHQRLLTLSTSVDPEKQFPYHRFNVERDMHEIELHEWDAMELLGAHTTAYMEELERELKRNECVQMLINPPPIQFIHLLSPKHFLMPYQRNPHFMGRDHLLSLLSDKLRDTTARKYNHRVAIYGMGGVGKTQLAIEYVYRNEAKYHSIFWISSADQAALLSGFGEIARVTGCVPNLDVGRNPDEVAKSVLIWLRKQDGWLLVMDNMDEISVAADYLPHMAPGGHTLITTRNPDHFTIPAEGLQIPVLGEDAAIELLLLRCQITCADESPDRTHAAHIVRELGCLALAIEQAAAFIRSSIGIDEFLAIYHKSRHQFLRRELSKNHPYPTSVAATFLLSLNRLDSVENGAQAIALLRLLAFLNPDGVLIDFLRSGSRGLDDAIREIIDDEFVFHDTLEILQRYALVGLSQNKDNVVIHRLVQAVVKDMLDETEIDTFRESVIGLCKSAFPDLDIDEAPTIAERIECRRLQNQILEPVIEAAEAYSLKGSKLLCKIGHFLHWEGKYHDSERVERLRVRINSDFLGENDPVTLCSLHALGSTLWRSGKLNEAADLMEKASQGLIRALGEEHLDTLRSMTEFALILRRQGKLDQATVMAKKVLETTIKVFGEEHIDRLSAMANLALALSSQGELDQAAALEEKVLEARTKVLGAEHPDTLTALSNHAQTLSGQGKFEQAAAMEEKVLEARIKVLGEEDPDTLTALAKLAAMLWRQGMFDQAATMLEKVLATRIKVLGEEHPDTLTGMSNLALFYKDLGRRLEAIDTLKKAVDGMRKVFGVDHPDTLNRIKLYNEWLTKENSVRPSEAYLMV